MALNPKLIEQNCCPPLCKSCRRAWRQWTPLEHLSICTNLNAAARDDTAFTVAVVDDSLTSLLRSLFPRQGEDGSWRSWTINSNVKIGLLLLQCRLHSAREEDRMKFTSNYIKQRKVLYGCITILPQDHNARWCWCTGQPRGRPGRCCSGLSRQSTEWSLGWLVSEPLPTVTQGTYLSTAEIKVLLSDKYPAAVLSVSHYTLQYNNPMWWTLPSLKKSGDV